MSTHSSRVQPDKPDMRHILHRVTFGMEMERGKVGHSGIPKGGNSDCYTFMLNIRVQEISLT